MRAEYYVDSGWTQVKLRFFWFDLGAELELHTVGLMTRNTELNRKHLNPKHCRTPGRTGSLGMRFSSTFQLCPTLRLLRFKCLSPKRPPLCSEIEDEGRELCQALVFAEQMSVFARCGTRHVCRGGVQLDSLHPQHQTSTPHEPQPHSPNPQLPQLPRPLNPQP